MHLSKLHGLGNDFLVLLDDGQDTTGSAAAGPGLARSLCDRRTGVGADGLIRSERTPHGITFDLWNADGSTAEMSGNGVRCLALAARRKGWWADTAEPLAVDTPAGRRAVRWVDGDDTAATSSVDMGEVTPAPEAWIGEGADPDRGIVGSCAVELGNPHLVVLLDGDTLPGRADMDAGVEAIEAVFPDGVNIELIVRGPGVDEISMLVHERGAGWTQACGTGSCAVAYVARSFGWTTDEVVVHNPGGSVRVTLEGNAARLTGPAVWIADITTGATP